MNSVINPRVFGEKTIGLLRALTFNRASISATHQSTQNALISETDAPIELQNPYTKERKICILCKYNIEPDWKNVRLLSQFQSRFTGRLYGRHITGLCKAKQEKVEREVGKAQAAGLMPTYTKEIKYVNDPEIYDLNNPFKPHKY